MKSQIAKHLLYLVLICISSLSFAEEDCNPYFTRWLQNMRSMDLAKGYDDCKARNRVEQARNAQAEQERRAEQERAEQERARQAQIAAQEQRKREQAAAIAREREQKLAAEKIPLRAELDAQMDQLGVGQLFSKADELANRGHNDLAKVALRALLGKFPNHPLAAPAAQMMSGMPDR